MPIIGGIQALFIQAFLYATQSSRIMSNPDAISAQSIQNSGTSKKLEILIYAIDAGNDCVNYE